MKKTGSMILTIILVLAALAGGFVLGRVTAPKSTVSPEETVEAPVQEGIAANGTLADEPEPAQIGTADDLVVKLDSADIDDGKASVTGTLTNNGEGTFLNVSLIGSFTDKDGKEVASEGYSFDRITPGEEATFVIAVSDVSGVHSCNVEIESFSTAE